MSSVPCTQVAVAGLESMRRLMVNRDCARPALGNLRAHLTLVLMLLREVFVADTS